VSFGGHSLVARRARYAKSNTHAPEAMTRNLLINSSHEGGRGNGLETRPRAKSPKRGDVIPNFPVLEDRGTLALQDGGQFNLGHNI